MAHRLMAITTAQRTSNVVNARWEHFDLDADVPRWVIPREQMKRRKATHDHKVILNFVIAAELREWKQIPATSFQIALRGIS